MSANTPEEESTDKYHITYYRKNRSRILKRNKEHYFKNRTKYKNYHSDYLQKNKSLIRQRACVNSKRYYYRNKERNKEQNNEYKLRRKQLILDAKEKERFVDIIILNFD